MKKIIIILLALLITGCTNYEDINDLSIISNFAIEYDKNIYKITMQEIIPKNNDGKVEYSYKYRTSKSKSLDKAFNKIIDHSPKKIYLKKTQNIIIKNNDKEVLHNLRKYYIKNKNINKNVSIVITNNSIDKVLNINTDYMYIDSVLKTKKITINEIVKKRKIKVPIIKIMDKELIFSKYYNYSHK